MKNLELKELGVQEMNSAEMTNVNGGLLGINIDLSSFLAQVGKTVTDTLAFVNAQFTILGNALKAL